MEVIGQFHVPGALPSATETPVVTEEGVGWSPRAGMDVFDKRKKKSFTLAGYRRRFLGYPLYRLIFVKFIPLCSIVLKLTNVLPLTTIILFVSSLYMLHVAIVLTILRR
jgi:hypothetical protein